LSCQEGIAACDAAETSLVLAYRSAA